MMLEQVGLGKTSRKTFFRRATFFQGPHVYIASSLKAPETHVARKENQAYQEHLAGVGDGGRGWFVEL